MSLPDAMRMRRLMPGEWWELPYVGVATRIGQVSSFTANDTRKHVDTVKIADIDELSINFVREN